MSRLMLKDANQSLTCPEENEILFFERRHLLHDGPEPALEGYEAVGAFSAFVVERRVADQSRHVDVANLKVLRKKFNSNDCVSYWLRYFLEKIVAIINSC